MRRARCQVNMKTLSLGLLLLFACSGADAAPNPLFDVKFEDGSGGIHMLTLGFYRKVPPPVVVDKMLRDLLNEAIAFDPTKDILATAFKEGVTLAEDQYSGSLVYTATTHKVQTYEEYRGVKKSTTTGAGYTTEVKKEKTLEGSSQRGSGWMCRSCFRNSRAETLRIRRSRQK